MDDDRQTWEYKTFAPRNPPDLRSEFNDSVQHKSSLLVESAPPYLNVTQSIADKVAKHVCYNEKMMQNFVKHPAYQFIMNVASFTNDNVAKYWSDSSTLLQPTPYTISSDQVKTSEAFAREQADQDVHRWCTLVSTGVNMDTFTYVLGLECDSTFTPNDARKIFETITTTNIALNQLCPLLNKDTTIHDIIYKCMDTNEESETAEWGTDNTDEESETDEDGTDINYEESKIAEGGMSSNVNEDSERAEGGMSSNVNEDSERASNRGSGARRSLRYGRERQNTQRQAESPGTPKPTTPIITPQLQINQTAGRSSGTPPTPQTSPKTPSTPPTSFIKCIQNPILFQQWLYGQQTQTEKTETQTEKTEKLQFNNKFSLSSDIVYQDLSGLRLTKSTVSQSNNARDYWNRDVTNFFNVRFEFHLHKHLLNHYEEKIAFETRKWYGNNPSLRNGIYFSPIIYGHMNETVHALTHVYAHKFKGCEAEDFICSKKHRYLFSKCVALAIRASQVLSGKRYGLDKSYMRVNLERRKAMAAWKNVDRPPKQFKSTDTSSLSQNRHEHQVVTYQPDMSAFKRRKTNT